MVFTPGTPFIATRVQFQPPCTDDSHRILAEPARYRLDVDIPQTWHGHRSLPLANGISYTIGVCVLLFSSGPLPVAKDAQLFKGLFTIILANVRFWHSAFSTTTSD